MTDREHPSGEGAGGTSAGAALRRARLERGLSPGDLARLSGVPSWEVSALERDDPRALPDRFGALQALRRAAAQLGLDPGPLALAALDAWSAASGAAPGTASASRAQPPTAAVQVLPGGRAPRRRGARAAVALRVATGTATAVLLAALAALALVKLGPGTHLEATAGPLASPVATTAPTTQGRGAQTGTPAPAGARPSLARTTTGPGRATYTVGAPTFEVTVTASYRCWVQVRPRSGGPPIYAGILGGGSKRSFRATGPIVVRVGAAGVMVHVSAGGTRIGDLAPASAPFDFTFVPSASSSAVA